MARAVTTRTGLPTDPGIVELALLELDEAGLLVPELAEASHPLASAGMSRRTLIKRLALGAGAVTLLPVVQTLVGSSQLAAATPSRTHTATDSLVADPKTATTTAGTPVDITLTTTGGFATPTSTSSPSTPNPPTGRWCWSTPWPPTRPPPGSAERTRSPTSWPSASPSATPCPLVLRTPGPPQDGHRTGHGDGDGRPGADHHQLDHHDRTHVHHRPGGRGNHGPADLHRLNQQLRAEDLDPAARQSLMALASPEPFVGLPSHQLFRHVLDGRTRRLTDDVAACGNPSS